MQSKSNSGTGHADSASTEWKDTGKTDGGSSSTIDDQNEVSTLPKAANDTTVPNDSDAPESPASKEAKPPSDVQAVAKNEDIEALFEQINKNKKSNAAAVETQQADPTPPPQDAPSATELDVSESATADDIAALFATVKGAAQPAAPKPSETPTPKAAQSTAEDENGTASADDIAALFASVQNTPKAQQAVVPPPVESTPVQDVSTTPAPAPENLDEAASADDIAALFASAKNNKQGTPPKAQPVAPPAPTAAAPVASENLEETASADDIAALFAASKKPAPPNKAPAEINNAKAPPAEITAEGKKNIEALVQNLNESASADEIEALFANLK